MSVKVQQKRSRQEVILTVEPPCATTSPKQPAPIRATYQKHRDISPVKALLLEPLKNDHLSYATAHTFWPDGFVVFHCF